MAKKKTMGEIKAQSWKDIQQLSKRELKEQINTLNAVANKRIKRLQDRDLLSPATRELEKFSLQKSYTKQGLQKQLSQLTNFLDMKTSTITGAKEYTKFTNKLAENMNLTEDPNARSKVWEIIERYRETHPHIVQTGSKETYEKIANIVGQYGVVDPTEIEQIRQRETEFTDDFELFPEDVDTENEFEYIITDGERYDLF